MRGTAVCLLAIAIVFAIGCGGSSNGVGRGGSQSPVTPTLTLSPGTSTVSTVQALKVTVSVSAGLTFHKVRKTVSNPGKGGRPRTGGRVKMGR